VEEPELSSTPRPPCLCIFILIIISAQQKVVIIVVVILEWPAHCSYVRLFDLHGILRHTQHKIKTRKKFAQKLYKIKMDYEELNKNSE